MDVCEQQTKNPSVSEMIKEVPNCSHSLPARGFKDFEPSNTLAEAKQIEDALKQQAAMLAVTKVDKLSFLVAAEWNADRKLALVTRRASGHFDVIGHEENARLWLYAEEILLLLELSRAELMYGGVSMSIQQGYAMLLGEETGCRDIEYSVYKHLSLLGYRILRHRACPTQYELDIRLEQCSSKSSRKLREEKDIICVDQMPETLMEDYPADTRADSSPPENIVLPLPSNFPATAQVETRERSVSRSSFSKESPASPEEIIDEKFPSDFVVLDEWTAADEHDETANASPSILIDDDKEIIGVTLEAKEVPDDSSQDCIVLQQNPLSETIVMDDVVKPPSPKYLAEICPQICMEPATDIPNPGSDIAPRLNPSEIIPPEKAENDKPETSKSQEDVDENEPCIFSDLNAFLAEICPSPKRQEDISPMSSHTESDFIGVSGIDASETVLNSLAEVNAYDIVEDTDNTADNYSDDDEYCKLTPGFNVVVRQNMCPVLLDIPEPVERSTPKKDDSEIQIYGKRQAETVEEVGSNKRLRTASEQEPIDKEPTLDSGASSLPGSDIAGLSKEPLVNGGRTDVECDSESDSTASIPVEDTEESSSEDEDCLNIESNREGLDSPVMVEEDSDLEIIEVTNMEDLSITISNKRKQTGDDVRSVKRPKIIEVINLSDEETESEESDNETEDLNPPEEERQDETDVMSVGSSSDSIEETRPGRQKYWTPNLLEDSDRTTILKSIVNIANKTQVDLTVDWRYVPSNCNPTDKRVKVFRLNAIGIGGKPSVDYIPAHKVIEARGNASEFVPLAAPSSSIPSLFDLQPPGTLPLPLRGHLAQPVNPWVQMGQQNFLPNYQMTIHNPFHQPQPQWAQPSSAFIAPNNMGYAIPGSFAPPRHFAPLLHVVHTPRMRNRTIRGVTKIVRPQMYEPPVCVGGQGQGWFQQNNVFSTPNPIRVELPPPVKPEPWIPGVMQKMKNEVPVTVATTRPSSAVKEERSVTPRTAVPGPNVDDIAVGSFTVKYILSCSQKTTRKQRLRLGLEWARMLQTKQLLPSTCHILKCFEKKSPKLAGLRSKLSKALREHTERDMTNLAHRNHVKLETQITSSEWDGYTSNQMMQMADVCPQMKSLNNSQISNLNVGIQRKATGEELAKCQRKVMLHVGQMMGNYVKTLLKSKPESLNIVNKLIECIGVVNIPGLKPSPESLELLRDNYLRELNPQIGEVAEAAAEPIILDEDFQKLLRDSRALIDSGASEETFGIVGLNTLIAKINEWVNFTPPNMIAWNRTKKKLEDGLKLNFNDYNVLYIAQSSDCRLYYILPLMINVAYMERTPSKPSVFGINSTGGFWQKQVKGLIKVCPWLNALGPSKLKPLTRTLKLIDTLGRHPSKYHMSLLEYICDMLTRTAKYFLRTNQQPSVEVDSLIAWANLVKVSGKKLEFSDLVRRFRNEGELCSQETISQSYAIGGSSEIPENIELSESSEESDGAEDTSSKTQSETSLKDDSSKDLSPNDNTLPERSKELNAQVMEIVASLTLSEEQNETWKRAKERMANDEAFVAEDLELFRFVASKDERFREIEHLLGIGQVATDKDPVREENPQEMEVTEESKENSYQSSSSEEEVVEPLLKPSDCTDYASVMSKLGIIRSAELTGVSTTFKISYDLYLPPTTNSAPFRKSDPGKPDYRIIVLRPDDPIPGATEISSLDKSFPDRVPVLFAIVRRGTVSFLRLDAIQLPADLTEYGPETAS